MRCVCVYVCECEPSDKTARNKVKERVGLKSYIKQMKNALDILIIAKKRISELNIAGTF